MQGWLIFLLTMLLTWSSGAVQEYQSRSLADTVQPSSAAQTVPATCPVTLPPEQPFSAPPPNTPSAPWPGMFWYGSASLWTALPTTGVWSGLPLNPEGYTQKVVWWRQGLWWKDEPQPALVVTGRRLDADAPPLNVSQANGVFAEDMQSAMMVGVDFPTLGCWEISGTYHDATLSFVVWVAP